MVAAHTINVGGGRAGIRWYELRESGNGWDLYQEGTFGPDDGLYRWMPSAAMNAAGDIGIGYLVASTTTYVSTAATGQSAVNSGSGFLDAEETICAAGTGVQEGVGRSGDYSSTSVDPTADTFWHTNEVFINSGQYQWATYVCEFSVGSGEPPANQPPTASFDFNCADLACDFTDASSDSDGEVVAWSWNFGDGNTSTAQSPSHTYAADGTYTVVLTVTDDGDLTDSDSQDVTVSSGSQNTPPTAAFTFTCTDLDCSFFDQSTDTEGSVVAWSWSFGDGGTSSAQDPSHAYVSGGTYTVTLTVTDDGDLTDSASDDVTVTAPSTGITLTASGYKSRGIRFVDLAWSGATSTNVDIYRDGGLIDTVGGSAYTDNLGRASGTFTYKVCEEGTSTCSNTAAVTF
jgi:PKD repeat protein